MAITQVVVCETMSNQQKSKGSATSDPPVAPDELRSRLKLVRQKLKQTRANQPKPVMIHQLRVSTRRATAAIESMSEYLPNQPSENCLSALRKVRHLAGDVRDLDILRDRFTSDTERAELPVSEKQLNDLCKFIKRRRRKLARRLREHQLQPQQARQQKTLPRKFRWRGDGDEPNLEKYARDTLAHDAQESLRRIEPWPEEPLALHELRLSLKRLRYAVEFFRDVIVTKEFDLVHRQLKRLQVELGAISDGRAMTDILSRLQRHCPKRLVEVVETLNQSEQSKLEATCREFLSRWTDDRRRELQTMLSSLADQDARHANSMKNEAG